MNILIDELPYTVTVAGQQIPINTDYRTGIFFEQCLNDLTLTDDEKLTQVLELYYGEGLIPLLTNIETVQEAIQGIMWFYRCGAEETAEENTEDHSSEKDPLFSYEHDAAYIYAAFIEAYNIDLAKNRLHWWQFRALFLGLPDTVQFSKIMGYRAMEIPAKMPKAQKKFYQRMKRIYKLPDPPEKVRLEKELEAILANGGDISQLMK